MNIKSSKIVFGLLLMSLFLCSFALKGQENGNIVRSTIIEELEGQKYYIHFVRPGETLNGIARLYRESISTIKAENPGLEGDAKPGQILKIPYGGVNEHKVIEKDMEKPSLYTYEYHTVRAKETLYGLSKKYNVAIEVLKSLNPVIVTRGLLIGQVLKIPVNSEKELVAITPDNDNTAKRTDTLTIRKEEIHTSGDTIIPDYAYTVKAGETIYSLTKTLNVSADELYRLNPPLKEGLKAGQKLILPEQETKPIGSIEIRKDTLVYYEFHKVRRKETLYGISKNYNISIDELFLLNPVLKDGLKKRQKIKIAVKDESRFDKVESGTLYIYVYKLPEPIEEEAPNKVLPECLDISNFDNHYNVALMIPLYLEQLDTLGGFSDIDPSSIKGFRFLQFYEGVKMAVDSLERSGVHADFFLYDVDHQPSKLQKVLSDPELKEMDLIIGPFYKRTFSLASGFAEKNEIPIVNPFTRRDDILDNPYAFMVNTPIEFQLKRMLEYIYDNYPNSNIMLVRPDVYRFENQAAIIKQEFEKLLKKEARIPNIHIFSAIIENALSDTSLPANTVRDSLLIENILVSTNEIGNTLNDTSTFENPLKEVIYYRDSVNGIALNSSIVRHNVVIALTEDKLFTLRLLTQLNSFRDSLDFTVFGSGQWQDYNLDPNYLMDLNVHLFTSDFVDYNSPATQAFVRNFYKSFKSLPQDNYYAFKGFDIAYFFGLAIATYGKHFDQCIPFMKKKFFSQGFDFNRCGEGGFENHHSHILYYDDYELEEVKGNEAEPHAKAKVINAYQ